MVRSFIVVCGFFCLMNAAHGAEWAWANFQNIFGGPPQAEAKDEKMPEHRTYRILAGEKCLEASRGSQLATEQHTGVHCFLKYIRQNGTIIDSRGFFGDVGTAMEPDPCLGTFELVKENATPEDWDKVLAVFNRYSREDYSLFRRNCCHVVREAVQALEVEVPPGLARANQSVTSPCDRVCPLEER